MKELVPAREPQPGEIADGEPVTTSEDVARWNRRLRWKQAHWGGLRVKRAFFRCPWPCTRGQYEQVRKNAVERWLATMDKQGWDLKSKVAVDGNKREEATEWSGDWAIALPGYVEIPVAAMFQQRKVEPMRVEVLVAG
jgi:hypothetical protein